MNAQPFRQRNGFIDNFDASSCGLTAGSIFIFVVKPQDERTIKNVIKMEKLFCVYILASSCKGTLYIGLTSNLSARIWQHKNKVVEGFTKKYKVNKLVYYEIHGNAENAIKREHRLKFWKREWKMDLIEKNNPEWEDLYESICH